MFFIGKGGAKARCGRRHRLKERRSSGD
jgi:hypothetical protein